MNVLIAPDKFKGSLSASLVCDAIAEGLRQVAPALIIKKLPIADGGEGSSEVLTEYAGGSTVEVRVRDPLCRPVTARYGLSPDRETAFMEMAQASGLQLLTVSERNPLYTTTLGTGDMIRHALDAGVENIVLGIGGSATNDAGIGMMTALGLTYYDHAGGRVKATGENLRSIVSFDSSALDSRLSNTNFTIFCDVDNPLHGLQGAAFIFAPQKGASLHEVRILDDGLVCYQSVLEKALGRSVDFPGAGAGGGLPASLKAFTKLTIRGGMEFIAEFIRLHDHISWADAIITGEGKVDQQTLSGKVVKGVSGYAAALGKPVLAVAGVSELDEATLAGIGVSKIVTLADETTTVEQAIAQAYGLIRDRIAGTWQNFSRGL